MHNSELDQQDQRTTSSMEDSAAMTVEFLRARLLSERSVSKSARQRADELAKRVVELEEQLRIVSLQRKMAEKATADVLAILESQGLSDFSEEFDSDQETPHESRREGEMSIDSQVRRNRSDELSGSDVDSSHKPGRNLSWKGRIDSPHSFEKYKASNVGRKNSIASISSSPKHCQGKSCRKIRHRDTRSVVEESSDESFKVNTPENEDASTSGFPDYSNGEPDIMGGESKIQEQQVLSGVTLGNSHDLHGHGKEKDMEKALEHQAQLIGQYEAMEKAQREWEEKFRENNSSTPDSCDPGNHSDITEERDEVKAQVPCPAAVLTSHAQQAKSEVENVCLLGLSETKTNGFLPTSHNDKGGINDQKNTSILASGSSSQEAQVSLAKEEQDQEIPESCHHHASSSSLHGPHLHSSFKHPPADSFSEDVHGVLPQGAPPGNGNLALVPHEPPRELRGVLDSLKQARLSLKQKINRFPFVEGGYASKAIEPLVSESKGRDRFEIPVGCSGLFRLPTDFSAEANTRSNLLNSASRIASENFYPDEGTAEASGGQFGTSPYYMETRLNFFPDDQSLKSQYTENRLRLDIQNSHLDPYLERGLRSSSRDFYPTYPIHPSRELMPRMPFSERFSRPYPPYPSRIVGGPPADPFSFHEDRVMPNGYR
ncbi:Transcriptional regulator ATRX [Quillaja saponaria]|uniref:Transcriptional regulator ATRX n=1 Tax=Quillaja saponaria TaxID=32244 RepID=A0AAD7Q537_QUISA|nr:Transcriptional regulator ATRX [Quillaja saponaria]